MFSQISAIKTSLAQEVSSLVHRKRSDMSTLVDSIHGTGSQDVPSYRRIDDEVDAQSTNAFRRSCLDQFYWSMALGFGF